jgi:phosphoribosylaminoimidazolecarboxamide formyltransferase/IMP cyclohydrolase
MAKHGIRPIDLVCINLYPFEETVAKMAGAAGGTPAPQAPQAEAIEQIDIGGPSMIRSAAKNFAWVTVVTSPAAYDRVATELRTHNGATSLKLRGELAAAAFGRTSEYDAAIASYLTRSGALAFPHVLRLGYVKADELRYGENPHQAAALYRDPVFRGQSVVGARQVHGKQLSFNNINDAAAALDLARALRFLAPQWPGACVIKHANPCGAAVCPLCRDAVDAAIAGNPQAAYGGILAVNVPLDRAAAERLCDKDVFLEVIVAPGFDAHGLALLRARWTGVRLLEVEAEPPAGARARELEYRSIPGGMLVQDRDAMIGQVASWRHAAGPAPSEHQLAAGAFAETAVRFLTSNAVAIASPARAGGAMLVGAGSGQVDRVSACRIAADKAGERARGAVAASDAFFPFADGPQVLIDAGVTMLVNPGGSKRDQETLDLCERAGVTCMVTGVRHFRH